ncbi:hypothetical protein GGI1_20548, partial [Acidithiobacillus sp. GGI-221]
MTSGRLAAETVIALKEMKLPCTGPHLRPLQNR